MWPLLVPLVLQCSLISSLPVTEDVRTTRQVNPAECCPCPGADENADGLGRADDSVGDSSFGSPSLLPGSVRNDDCPCMQRDADSVASPSSILPRKVLRFRNSLSQPGEDPKPLLHPEVDLASSVLETLREATDEEYREALARDAAKSAARSSDDDLKTSPTSIVTIILNPVDLDNDVLGQGRHIHESRCIHGPLGSAKVANVQTRPLPHLIRELLGMPVDKVRRNELMMLDNAVAPSNVREQIVDSSNVQEVKVIPDSEVRSVSGPTTPKLPSLIDNIKEFTSKARANFEDAIKKMPKLNLPFNPRLDEPQQTSSPSIESVVSERIPDETENQKSVNNASDNIENDNCISPSNIKQSVVQNEDQKVPDLREKTSAPLLPPIDLLKPILPTNLVKLRDAESISKILHDNIGEKEIKIKVPYLKNNPLFQEELSPKSDYYSNSWKIPTLNDLFQSNPTTQKSLVKPEMNDIDKAVVEPSMVNAESEPFRTQIIDFIPSASETRMIEITPAQPATELEEQRDGEIQYEDLSDGAVDRGIIESLSNVKFTLSSEKFNTMKNDPVDCNEAVAIFDPVDEEQDPEADLSSLEGTADVVQSDDANTDNISVSDTTPEASVMNPIETMPSEEPKVIVIPTLKDKVLNKLQEIKNGRNTKFDAFSNKNSERQASVIDCATKVATETEELKPVLNDDENILNPVTSKELQDMSDNEAVASFDSGDEQQDPKADLSSLDETDDVVQSDDANIENISVSDTTPEASVTSPVEEMTSEESKVEVLPTLKDKVLNKLQEIKNGRNTKFDAFTNKNSETQASVINCATKAATEIEELKPVLNDDENILNPVTSKELQDMSDSLLDESRIREVMVDPDNENTEPQPINKNNAILIHSSEADVFDSSNGKIDPENRNISENNNDNVVEASTNYENDQNLVKAACDSQLLASDREQKLGKEKSSGTEMKADSSDAIPSLAVPALLNNRNSLLGSRLMQNPIVQPAALPDIKNIFPALDLTDIFKSNSRLPSLEDLRSRLSEIFRRDDEDDGSLDPLSLGATQSLGSPLSLRRPMEEVDLDIFHLNPLQPSRTKALKSNIPKEGLNLNSFKAKLQVPTEIVQPLKLQSLKSFIGKDGNILGAKLSVAPKVKKFGTLGKSKPILLSDLSSKTDTLRQSLPDLPNLESLRSSLDPNNLLVSPNFLLPQLPAIETLRSADPLLQIDALKENIQRDASSAINNIQQSVASTLNEAKLRHANVLGSQVKLEPSSLRENLERVRLDFNDRLQSMQSDIATRLPLINTDALKLTNDFASNNLLQVPNVRSSKTKQPKFVTKSRKTDTSKTPKTSSNIKQTTAFRNISKDTSKLKSAEGLSSRKPATFKIPATTPKPRTLTEKKASRSKIPSLNSKKVFETGLKDSSTAENYKSPSKLASSQTRFSQDKLGSLTPSYGLFQRENSNKPGLVKSKASVTQPNVKERISNLDIMPQRKNMKSSNAGSNLDGALLRSSLNKGLNAGSLRLSDAPGKSPLTDITESLNTRLSSPLQLTKDLVEGASNQDSFSSFPKLSIENLKKPQEVIDEIVTSARDALSKVNLNLPLQKPDDIFPTLHSPSELSEKLQSSIDPLRNIVPLDALKNSKVVEIASPSEVLTSLRDTIKERFSEIDLKPHKLQGPHEGKINKMLQGATDLVGSVAPPSQLLDNLKASMNDRATSLSFPQVQSLPKLDLLDNLQNISPDDIINNLRSSARDAFSNLDLKPPSGPFQLRTNGDLLPGASENLKSLNSGPVINKLKSSIQERLTNPNLQFPAVNTENLKSVNEYNLTDEKIKSVNPDLLSPEAIVTKLRNSLKDRFPNLDIARKKDLAESPSDSMRSVVASPRKPLKKSVTYKCKMVCEEVDDE